MDISLDPKPGTFNILQCGDIFKIQLEFHNEKLTPFLRTNLGGVEESRKSLISQTEHHSSNSSNEWMDLPFTKGENDKFYINLPLTEVGLFEAKVWFHERNSHKTIWTSGDNIQVKVEPASTIANNSIYSVFTRQFGPNKDKSNSVLDNQALIDELDNKGYHVIPPSGTFRDVKKELNHIIVDMGFRIIQLLPIHPIPTTFARMGRFGSPYASLDFFAVDPSLAEFDKQATPMDQFIELVDEIHRHKAQLFLDIPVDHTGWASTLQKDHPEYFVKDEEGHYVSPGAWGTIWEDLIKLDFNNKEVHRMMAKVFLFWCHKGVDGFRCDAGYMVPINAWKYIIAKVRMQFPNTIFLLEGLGGPWKITDQLLTEGTFAWAYSELFQNYSKDEIVVSINNTLRVTEQKGGLINFSETHDNNRLADISHEWSYMRNLLNALTAPAGAFGITNGVEYYAKEKINVHQAKGLNWGNKENITSLFKNITSLFKWHPAFTAKAKIELVHESNPHLIVIKRTYDINKELLIAINLNLDYSQQYSITDRKYDLLSRSWMQEQVNIPAGKAICLDKNEDFYFSEQYFDDFCISQQTKEALLKTYQHIVGFKHIENDFINKQLSFFTETPIDFCTKFGFSFAKIVFWNTETDDQRHVMCPSKGIVIIQSKQDFYYKLSNNHVVVNKGSAILQSNGKYFSCVLMPTNHHSESAYLDLRVSLMTCHTSHKEGKIALLPQEESLFFKQEFTTKEVLKRNIHALCSNPNGSISYLNGIWGQYNSKYEGFLAVNSDKEVPTDRITMISRFRIWIVCNDYSHELGINSQQLFAADGASRAMWTFKIPTGQGQYIILHIHLTLHQKLNAITLHIERDNRKQKFDILSANTPVEIIIRPDVEHRNHHETTKAFEGAEKLFPQGITKQKKGFTFNPYNETSLNILANNGEFICEPEWKYMNELSVEKERGMDHCTDFFSPGYFSCKLTETLNLRAFVNDEKPDIIIPKLINIIISKKQALLRSMKHYIVKRNDGQTILAGYPWFLDWGRDTLICLRGIIKAKMKSEAKDIILTFARFEEKGTIPNMIRGNNASNRETSDAPLWFMVAIKEYLEQFKDLSLLSQKCGNRNIKQIVLSIVENYIKGTPNGILMDPDSGLIYSPSHFTWMDTNYPAGSPREGYPIEIQALWYASIDLLTTIAPDKKWNELKEKVILNTHHYFVLSNNKGLSDCLHTKGYQPINKAIKDNYCRPNQLFSVTLQLTRDKKVIKHILMSTQNLIIPGAIRSLHNSKVSPPLEICHFDGLLNDPQHPYWGKYTGDEDTQRKPAYHNGTAWSWPFFTYCEALYQYTEDKNNTLAFLMSTKENIERGIINHLPEISDGDAPHAQKGCLAQAWSITEFYRLEKILKS